MLHSLLTIVLQLNILPDSIFYAIKINTDMSNFEHKSLSKFLTIFL